MKFVVFDSMAQRYEFKTLEEALAYIKTHFTTTEGNISITLYRERD